MKTQVNYFILSEINSLNHFSRFSGFKLFTNLNEESVNIDYIIYYDTS